VLLLKSQAYGGGTQGHGQVGAGEFRVVFSPKSLGGYVILSKDVILRYG
jgi:hypothetical protein